MTFNKVVLLIIKTVLLLFLARPSIAKYTQLHLITVSFNLQVPNDFHNTTYQTSLPAGTATPIPEFLTLLGLPMYTHAFVRHGFAMVATLQALHEGDLKRLGVVDQRHIKRIADAIKMLGEGDGKAFSLPTAIVSQRIHKLPSKLTDKV